MKNIVLLAVVFSTPFLFSCLSKTKEKQTETSAYINVAPLSQNNDLQKSIERGRVIYDEFCIQCHGADGKGQKKIFPPLDGADWLTDKRTESIHAVKYGQSGEIVVNGVTYNNVMPPMGLTNKEVADVMNYVMNSWSNTQDKPVTVQEVEAIEP
jgi:mono/diheme cytochrome c family protein